MLKPYTMKVVCTVFSGGKTSNSLPITIRDPISLHCKLWVYVVAVANSSYIIYILTLHLGTTKATLKPKRRDGLSNRQWSMLFNLMIHKKSYHSFWVYIYSYI